jgi:hypothetical protein
MQINFFARGAMGIHPEHPHDHTVDVERLTEPLLSVAMSALTAGTLPSFTGWGQQFWVSRVQLAAVAGFGRKLYDPQDPYFVPPEAMLRMPYLREPVTAQSPPYQQKYLEVARRAAAYLVTLRNEMPARPADLHIKPSRGVTSPLDQLITAQALQSYPSSEGRWVVAAEAGAYLPAGESFDNPSSAWYVDPHDWADQDEIDRLIADHRREWPEIYDDLPQTA